MTHILRISHRKDAMAEGNAKSIHLVTSDTEGSQRPCNWSRAALIIIPVLLVALLVAAVGTWMHKMQPAGTDEIAQAIQQCEGVKRQVLSAKFPLSRYELGDHLHACMTELERTSVLLEQQTAARQRLN